MSDTRYQILFDSLKDGNTENFTVHQVKAFRARVKALRAAGVKFTTWDTQNNPMSRQFSRLFFGGK